ncbi:MAG: twitching motility protein PilT [Acidobacteria bacterium]|nr:twitching motility protein PilT [Acidobacteriota bacterium]
MSCLVDTNVLLRSVQKTHLMQSESARSIALLILHDEMVSIVPQNLIEFWAVATRPTLNNGLGMSVDETSQHIAAFKIIFELLPDSDSIFKEWERLVIRHQVIGKRVHDARLAEAMLVHNLTHLLTFNDSDFKRFTEIAVVNPRDVT